MEQEREREKDNDKEAETETKGDTAQCKRERGTYPGHHGDQADHRHPCHP